MFARFFVLLLLFALAVPAVAMPLCHQDEAQANQSHDGHGKPAKPHHDEDKADQNHGCLACAAPIDRDSIAPSASHWVSAEPVATLLHSLRGLIPAPEPPPPRA